MLGIALCLLGGFTKFRANTEEFGPSETPRAQQRHRINCSQVAARAWCCLCLKTLEVLSFSPLSFCPSPPCAARPVSWRYWSSAPAHVVAAGRWGTCGAAAGAQGAYLELSSPFGVQNRILYLGMRPLLQAGPPVPPLHVRNGGLVCTVCVGMYVWEEGPGVFHRALKFPRLENDT